MVDLPSLAERQAAVDVAVHAFGVALREEPVDTSTASRLRPPISELCRVAREHGLAAEHLIIALKREMEEGAPWWGDQSPESHGRTRARIVTLAIELYFGDSSRPVRNVE
jgi:hypothetical protein